MAKTQAERNAIMARAFPDLYRPTTDEDRRIAAYPIDGMGFAIDADVRHYRTRLNGIVENCTKHTDGRFQYTVAWEDGSRTLVWETDLREVAR